MRYRKTKSGVCEKCGGKVPVPSWVLCNDCDPNRVTIASISKPKPVPQEPKKSKYDHILYEAVNPGTNYRTYCRNAGIPIPEKEELDL